MAFARVNGVVLHHEFRGAAGRPVLVFSNSLGTDFRIWNAVADRLQDRYQLVLYDKRGHGLSEATPGPYALIDHVHDLAALLDHLDIGRAAIVGLSVGGMIAQGLATLDPGRVAALVLSDTAHKIGTDESWNARIETIRAKDIAAVAEGILRVWFTPGYRSPEYPDFAGYRAMLTRSDVEGYLATCAAVRDADLTESTRALRLPVLCLVGDHDGSTPPDLVRSMADLIEDAEFHVIEDAGHLPCIEQPEVMASLIDAFLMKANCV
jgi:3-oxoadipate enol-lactonase